MWTFCIFGQIKYQIAMKTNVFKYPALAIVCTLFISCGKQIDQKSDGYYKTFKGIYYSPNNNWFNLGLTYLDDADSKSFIVLGQNYAKDKNHAYYKSKIIKEADVETFYVDTTGLAKDKNNVFVSDYYTSVCRPAICDIDIMTAEYFVHNQNGQDHLWLRDQQYVYLNEKRIDVDRNTFKSFHEWFIDKNWIYFLYCDSEKEEYKLLSVDSIQNPLETISGTAFYLRNGKDIIYLGKIAIHNVDIKSIKALDFTTCVVNDLFLFDGNVRLKDSIDVTTLQTVGCFLKDKNHVYYGAEILKGIDAATFRQTEEYCYKDKNGNYEFDFSAKKRSPLKRK